MEYIDDKLYSIYYLLIIYYIVYIFYYITVLQNQIVPVSLRS